MNDVAAPVKVKRQVSFLLGVGIFFIPVIFSWFLLRKGHSVLARVIGFAWLILSLLVILGSSSAPTNRSTAPSQQASTSSSAPAPAAAPVAPLKSFTAKQVASSYEENTVAADMQFKSKRVKVSGRITDINTDFMGRPYLVLAGTNEYFGPQFGFDQSDMSVMATLKKGTTVNVICTGKGDIAKVPMFEDCEMSK
jgi:hypothetical protein